MAGSHDPAQWQRLTTDLTTAMAEWRAAHPRATLREMEAALDSRWAQVRARMLEGMAHADPAAQWAGTDPATHPRCPDCQTPLQDRGTTPRILHTHGDADLTLNRSYGVCPACGAGLFPPG